MCTRRPSWPGGPEPHHSPGQWLGLGRISTPLVSVIISSFDSANLLQVALRALQQQTLDQDSFEILVVDDGSRDQSWTVLTRQLLVQRNLAICRQRHTGSPSAGRNRGLDVARGKYVFFHDADDYLEPPGLARLLSAAQWHRANIVVGPIAQPPRALDPPPATVPRADLLQDQLWRTLGPHKLFERKLIEDQGFRFCEDMVQGEDQVFTASCLFAARTVTSLAGPPVYLRRTLPGRKNLSRQPQTLEDKRLTLTRMTNLICANSTPGRRRDELLRRVFLRTLTPAFGRPFRSATGAERADFLHDLRTQVLPHLSIAIMTAATPAQRLLLRCAPTAAASDLAILFEVVSRDLRTHDAESGRLYDLGTRLNLVLGEDARRVSSVPFPSDPQIVAVTEVSRGWLVDVNLGSAGTYEGHLGIYLDPAADRNREVGQEVLAKSPQTRRFLISRTQLRRLAPRLEADPARVFRLSIQALEDGRPIACNNVRLSPSLTALPAAGRSASAGRVRVGLRSDRSLGVYLRPQRGLLRLAEALWG